MVSPWGKSNPYSWLQLIGLSEHTQSSSPPLLLQTIAAIYYRSIRARRKNLGLSQEALADAAQIDRGHMGKIERGERNVTFLNILKIASAVGWRPSELLHNAGL